MRADWGPDEPYLRDPWPMEPLPPDRLPAVVERDANGLLAEVGLPARPFGRLWLLRPPPPFDDLDDVLDAITAGASADGVPLMCCAELVAWTHDAVVRWFLPGE